MDATRFPERRRVVSTRELAELLSVQPDTVRRWARDGTIPFIRVGEKTLRYIPEDVLAALRNRAGRGTADAR